MSVTLGEQVVMAVAAVLAAAVEGGEPALSVDAIWKRLPAYIVSGKPTKKSVIGAIKAAGWTLWRRGDEILYRAPGAAADPLNQRGDNVSGEQLRLFIERIERLEEEKRGIADDIKDVYGEARSTGFDAKTMRKIVALRKMEKHHRDEADEMLTLYRDVLGLN